MKKALSFVLTLVIYLSLVTVPASAATDWDKYAPYDLSVNEAPADAYTYGTVMATFKVNDLPNWGEFAYQVEIEIRNDKVNGGAWGAGVVLSSDECNRDYKTVVNTYSVPVEWLFDFDWDGKATVEYRARVHIFDPVNTWVVNEDTKWSNTSSIGLKALQASDWAQPELEKANAIGLIPDVLKDADLTKSITRAEFAAVAVKVYENLTGKKATPVSPNPFKDTSDAEVLKAYSINVVNGTSATTFAPNDIINREQAATMLTRVLKTAYIPGWTLPTDGNYTLNFKQPEKFADDANISDYAKQSVYFMAANEIIKGTGNNMFSPRAVTTAEQAAGYASATREQAIIIGMRLVDNLKGKPVDYTQGAIQ